MIMKEIKLADLVRVKDKRACDESFLLEVDIVKIDEDNEIKKIHLSTGYTIEIWKC